MKKYIYILCAMLVAAFTSCSNNDLASETDGATRQVTLQVAADQGLNTRAADLTVNNYIVEVYKDAAYGTPANVFTGNTHTATSNNGSFSMILDKNQDYYCLLWADKDATVYNTSDLTAVTLQPDKAPVEAWQGKLNIAQGTNGTLSATLTRSVAKITLLENKKLASGASITLTFKQKPTFDVSKGETAGAEVDRTETITTATSIDGSITPVQVNTDDIFVLASTKDAEMPTLTFILAGDTENTEVANVPLKANYNTNIKGHYSKENGATFTITCDDSWAGNKEGTLASPYTSNVSLPAASNTTVGYYSARIKVDDIYYPGVKLGKGISTAGTYTTEVLPATGNVALSFYAFGWKTKTCSVKITVNNGGTIDGEASKTFAVKENYGATGNTPYNDMVFADSDFYTVALQGVTSATTLTIESLYGDGQTDARVILTGINVK